MTERSLEFLAKAVTYRILAGFFTAVLVLVVSGSLQLATTVGAADFIGKLVLYWLYEHLWEHSLKRAGASPSSTPAEQGHTHEH